MHGLCEFEGAVSCFLEASSEFGQEEDKESRTADLESNIMRLEAEFFSCVCTTELGKDSEEQLRKTLVTAERATELAKLESKFIL